MSEQYPITTSRVLPDLAATAAFAAEFAALVRPGDVIALDGPLGAGKTTWVRALVAALGGDGAMVASPTFTLLHQYQARMPVVHVDAYRLRDHRELLALGFAELSDEAVAVVEWAERVLAALPNATLWRIALAHRDDGGRQATVTPPSTRSATPAPGHE